MKNLEDDKVFQKALFDAIAKKKANPQYINKAMDSIWSTASKHFHGRDNEIIIYSEEFSPDECIVLVALFTHYSIPYTYSRRGIAVDFLDNDIDIISNFI